MNPPKETERYGSQALGYILEGRFNSYFRNKEIPVNKSDSEIENNQEEKQVNKKSKIVKNNVIEEANFLKQSKKSGKIIVMGSSEIIKNNLIDAQGQSPNAIFLLNLVDYANANSDWILMRSKQQRVNPLEPYDKDAGIFEAIFTNRNVLKWINMVILPILVVVKALLVYFVRVKRRRKVRVIFKQSS